MELGIWSSAKLLLLVVAMKTLIPQHASAATYPGNENDRLALISIKHYISVDPDGVLKSWNGSRHHCNWEGVHCDARHGRVTGLALSGMNLFGSISPHIGNLSFLKSIQLQDNRLHSEIPREVGRLFRLRHLNLSDNTLTGEIPVSLSYCSELRDVSLRSNGLAGKIPSELGSLQNLVSLNLRENNLTNEIPRSFGNLSALELLSLGYNNLEGSFPIELGSLMSLSILILGRNKLSGTVPASLFNISSMTVISLADNFFTGSLPTDIGFNLPNLQALGVGGNQFHGIIPASITNASKLEILDVPDNKFVGQLPYNLGNLQNLQRLNLGGNSLGQRARNDLDFIASLANCSSLQLLAIYRNNFGGELPNSIANFSLQFGRLYMGSNVISGRIPNGLARLENLYSLTMELNFFSGTIPKDFSAFRNLQVLSLAGNMLSGQIPSTLCNITSLYSLELQSNNFEGNMPSDLGNCQNLKTFNISYNKLTGILSPSIFSMSFSPTELDLSHNSLTGSLPPEVGKLENINNLNVSYNKFSGLIPETLGGCSSLEYLTMQGNSFQGRIPPKLGSLKGIQYLDLSQNNLSGQIPKDLGSLTFLNYLNLSFNNLEGQVPSGGVFRTPGSIILAENSKLCGGIPELQLPSCFIKKKKKNGILWIVIASSVSFAVIGISAVLFFSYQRRRRERVSSPMPLWDKKILSISYLELQRATDSFSPKNLVGSGAFGVVYKGKLDSGRFVAVKVLNLQTIGASTSFKAECNALRSIRHRNLLPLLTYCASIDSKGNEFKALVYKFMENGSLHTWLHPESVEEPNRRNLNLLQRLNIVSDVATALQYLHDHCGAIIVHRDLKPSNILLDNDFTAHVGDFGLARLLPKTTENSSGQGSSSTFAIKGSIGYAAPEYALGCKASIYGDVYSYGILLLEMLTGKRPTDEIFVDGLDLHNYVKKNLPEHYMKIIDPSIDRPIQREENIEMEPEDDGIQEEESNGSLRYFSGGEGNMQKCIISMFKIGIKCSESSPNDRMNMNEVIRQLQHMRDACFRGERDPTE